MTDTVVLSIVIVSLLIAVLALVATLIFTLKHFAQVLTVEKAPRFTRTQANRKAPKEEVTHGFPSA